ncbi:hypothetical protein GGR50DRAFT_417554 [Xylaria sp. CBS 124048]|nr:hypothetical protein GGR50DRAFT_417554 [Xylaria sp. CBS 124048]
MIAVAVLVLVPITCFCKSFHSVTSRSGVDTDLPTSYLPTYLPTYLPIYLLTICTVRLLTTYRLGGMYLLRYAYLINPGYTYLRVR